jgi:hypothetical protein
MAWTELGAELRAGRPRGALARLLVLAASAVLAGSGRQPPLPGGRFESCQTAGGARRALARAGFGAVRIESGAFLVATAVKPGPRPHSPRAAARTREKR